MLAITAQAFSQRPAKLFGLDVERESELALDFDMCAAWCLTKQGPPDRGSQLILEALSRIFSSDGEEGNTQHLDGMTVFEGRWDDYV